METFSGSNLQFSKKEGHNSIDLFFKNYLTFVNSLSFNFTPGNEENLLVEEERKDGNKFL